MKNIIMCLLLFVWGYCLNAGAVSPALNDESFIHLFELSSANLNYSSVIPEDSIICLCDDISLKAGYGYAYAQCDYDNLFRVEQIAVNSLCLKGDIGLAINRAQQLYEEAKKKKSQLGMVLALQAIGDTYMHSNQNEQALITFTEAVSKLANLGSDGMKARLFLQLVHVCKNLGGMKQMKVYLDRVEQLLNDSNEIKGRGHYGFYTLCYETLYYIGMGNAEQAQHNLTQISQEASLDESYLRWYYNVAFHYFTLVSNYEHALAYCDSTLGETRTGKNLNEYRNAMVDKALLLEKIGDKEKACQLYEEITELTDSLNIQRYMRQIDSLHVTFLADQLAVENAMAHNRLLNWILMGCGLILGSVICLFIIARKRNNILITSRKKLNIVREETAASIQSKSMFLSNMSHELRTPLNAIVGFSAILTSSDQIAAETRKQCGDSIKQNSDLLLKLVRDVMDLSGLKGENIQFTYKTYNVVSLCRNVVDTVEKVKQSAAILHFSTSLEQLDVFTDNGRLQQVLINLLVNATKFTKEGTITLTLQLDEARREAVFAVEDTGCGIPLERQPYIFERFEKLHEGVQGVGLGLSICQLIVEHVGGRIWVDPAYTCGARFVFTHPLGNGMKTEAI